MAEAEFEARRLAELLADANRQLEQFGRVTAQTQQEIVDAQMKAKFGINNYSAVVGKAGEALGAVASAGISAGKAMLEGKKGASALNGSLDDLAKAATIAGTALTLLMPGGIIIKGVVAAFTAVTAATIGAVKAANEMSDKLYKGYSGLAKSGGAAADGMTGVFNNAKKLGLSMNELDGFVSLINENSSDLAQFSGSVAAGRKRLADMGDALRGNREGFLAMGLSMQDVSEGMASYMRLQARTGLTQERSARDQAEAAKAYIYETDKLAKLTGLNAKAQQKVREDALTEQMFLARIRQLKAQDQHAEAERLEQLNVMLSAVDAEAAKGLRASVTGRLQDESARKLLMQTNGESLRVIHRITNEGMSASQGLNHLSSATREQLARSGDQLALIGVYNTNMGDYAGATRLAALSTRDMTELEKKAIEERKGQIEGADPITRKQAEIMNRQINTNEKMERALFSLIPASQDVMLTMQDGADKLADAFARIVKAINELLGIFGFGKKPRQIGKEEAAALKETNEAKAARDKAFENATIGQRMGFGMTAEQKAAQEKYDATLRRRQAVEEAAMAQHARETGTSMYQGSVEGMSVPMAAKGGLLSGPESGYLAMLHGTEMVVPVSGVGRKIEELGAASLASGMDTMNSQVTALGMGKDTAKKYNEIFKSMQASLQQPADEGKVEANKINALVKEISVDLGNQARTYERDAKNIKNFSDFQETYQRKMTDYMKEVLELCKDHKPEDVIGTAGAAPPGTAGAGAAGGGGILGRVMQAFASIMGTNAPGTEAPAGTGNAVGSSTPSQPATAMPATGNAVGSSTPSQPATAMPAASAPQGPEPHGAPVAAGGAADVKPKLTRVTSKSGKSTAVNAEFAPRFQGIIDYLDNIGYNIYSLGGYVDRDVRGQPGKKSVHAHGGAIDINPAENPFGSKLITDMPPEIGQVAAKLGLGWGGNWTSIKDAMHFSVAKHEGGTVKLSDGGVLTGPDSGYRPNIEMHGTEAVIPLKNGAVPVTLDGTMSLGSEAMALFQQMANQSAGMMAMMEEMVRAQRNSVDVQQKMLRNANS